MLKELERLPGDVICVSALPPFATGQARSLCKQLRQRCPKAKVILGLWAFPGGLEKAKEKVGLNCADAVATSLANVVSFVEEPQLHKQKSHLMEDVTTTAREGRNDSREFGIAREEIQTAGPNYRN
jgi:hypothetical protein